jgi:hypothetical protein
MNRTIRKTKNELIRLRRNEIFSPNMRVLVQEQRINHVQN